MLRKVRLPIVARPRRWVLVQNVFRLVDQVREPLLIVQRKRTHRNRRDISNFFAVKDHWHAGPRVGTVPLGDGSVLGWQPVVEGSVSRHDLNVPLGFQVSRNVLNGIHHAIIKPSEFKNHQRVVSALVNALDVAHKSGGKRYCVCFVLDDS